MDDLIDLPRLKRFMAMPPAADAMVDGILGDLITGVSAAIRNYVERDLLVQTYTERQDGNGKPEMFAAHWPIVSVQSLSIDGLTIPPAAVQFDDQLLMLVGYRFVRGRRNVQITYTAGFTETPEDIAQVACETVALRYRERDWQGYASKALAGEVVSFTNAAFSKASLLVLNSYRRTFLP